MKTNDTFKAINELDLDQIISKLTHPEAGEGWSLEKATSVAKEYRRFLCVMKAFPDQQTSPLIDVDTFWHYHILDTRKYAADCAHAFGYFVHHFPYLGLRGEEDEMMLEASGERMRDLYEQLFDEPYAQDVAAWCAFRDTDASTAAAGKAAWCAFRDTSDTKVAAGKAAWCAFEDTKPKAAKAAWCAFEDTKPKAARAAWCAFEDSTPRAAKAAWCAFTDVKPDKPAPTGTRGDGAAARAAAPAYPVPPPLGLHGVSASAHR